MGYTLRTDRFRYTEWWRTATSNQSGGGYTDRDVKLFGSPELVEDGESGLVVPVRDAQAIADAIEKLYCDPEYRNKLGEGARERIASNFRNEDTVTKIIAVYRDLVPDAELERRAPLPKPGRGNQEQ